MKKSFCLCVCKKNFNCKKCQKSANIKLKYKIDRVNKLHVERIHFRFEIIIGIDEECLNDYINKLSVKEKLCY